jgi:hypothetical protein
MAARDAAAMKADNPRRPLATPAPPVPLAVASARPVPTAGRDDGLPINNYELRIMNYEFRKDGDFLSNS